MSAEQILRMLVKAIGEEPVSVHQIVCQTHLNQRTVKKYLNLLFDIQKMPRFVKVEKELRILVRREKGTISLGPS
jgi:hypothetical protein